jgi:hypothetical protein
MSGSVVGDFQGTAEFRGAAPGLDHPALGAVLEPVRPVERSQPARISQLLGFLKVGAHSLARQHLGSHGEVHSVVYASCAARGRAAPCPPRGRWWRRGLG